MAEISKNNSDSDLSTDSWTLIEDVNSEEPNRSSETETPEEKKTNNGFLSFDEFLQEHLLEHDDEHERKLTRLKKVYKNKLKRGFKNIKAKSYGISVLISILLGLSAFATLCSTVSQTFASKEVEEFEKVDVVPVNNSLLLYDDLFKNLDDAMKELEDLNPKVKNEEVAVDLPQDTVNLLEPKNSTLNLFEEKPLVKPEPKNAVQNLSCSFKKFPIPQKKTKPAKSHWITIKEILLDRNVHVLISLVMTNVYLISLLAECFKKPTQKLCKDEKFLSDLEHCNPEELRRYLFKELPFWNAKFSNKRQKKKILAKERKPSPKKTVSSIDPWADRKRTINNLLFKSCPYLAQQKLATMLVKTSGCEAGKSECQRRFEELDKGQKKFDQLKQQQRDRIKMLKQKFRNEVAYIKDTEEEAHARADKINRTSQIFIKKLKSNREKYLMELKKVRELRQKLEKKKSACKDVAVGSYSVALPVVYNFGERFKTIREKFEGEEGKVAKQIKFY